jgi:8-oxo-dGTP pyrophosphatase MutT (NUDIX family)
MEQNQTQRAWYDSDHPAGRPLREGTGNVSLEATSRAEVAGVIVVNAVGQILVGFSTKRHVWDIPQGAVDYEETPIVAAIRELKEETGLEVGACDLERVAHFAHRTPEFVHAFENYIFFLKSPSLAGVRNMEPEKCKELKWFAPCQLPYPRGLSLRVALAIMGKTP